jgi:hypothetical protein
MREKYIIKYSDEKMFGIIVDEDARLVIIGGPRGMRSKMEIFIEKYLGFSVPEQQWKSTSKLAYAIDIGNLNIREIKKNIHWSGYATNAVIYSRVKSMGRLMR